MKLVLLATASSVTILAACSTAAVDDTTKTRATASAIVGGTTGSAP